MAIGKVNRMIVRLNDGGPTQSVGVLQGTPRKGGYLFIKMAGRKKAQWFPVVNIDKGGVPVIAYDVEQMPVVGNPDYVRQHESLMNRLNSRKQNQPIFQGKSPK